MAKHATVLTGLVAFPLSGGCVWFEGLADLHSIRRHRLRILLSAGGMPRNGRSIWAACGWFRQARAQHNKTPQPSATAQATPGGYLSGARLTNAQTLSA